MHSFFPSITTTRFYSTLVSDGVLSQAQRINRETTRNIGHKKLHKCTQSTYQQWEQSVINELYTDCCVYHTFSGQYKQTQSTKSVFAHSYFFLPTNFHLDNRLHQQVQRQRYARQQTIAVTLIPRSINKFGNVADTSSWPKNACRTTHC